MPTSPGPRRTRNSAAAAAWSRLLAAEPVVEPLGWFKEQAGLRGLEVWPDADGNLWALNGDPEEESADAHPGLTLLASLTPDGISGPSRALMLALAAVDVLNQLGFEPETPVSVLGQVGTSTSALPEEAIRRVGLLVELTDADVAVPAFAVVGSGPIGQTRELVVTGEPADGRDPLLTFAMTVLAVAKQARLAGAAARTTNVRVQRIDAAGRPVAMRADVRIDGPDPDAVFATVDRQGRDRAGRDGTDLTLVLKESHRDLAARCATALGVEPTVGPAPVRPNLAGDLEAATVAASTQASAPGQVVALTALVGELAG